MTDGVAMSTNSKLADKDTALPIVQSATSALEALQQAGVGLNAIEIAFTQALPWNDLKRELLDAYNKGKIPQVKIVAGAPGVGKGVPQNGTVLITLSGNIGVGGD